MNIEKLKKVIQEANPEIMELELGCYFSGEGVSKGLIFRIMNRFPFGFNAVYYHQGSGIVNGEFDIRKIKILGRPIRLADVLLALQRFSLDFLLIDDFLKMSYEEEHKKHWNTYEGYWNLKDNNLDNQSDELHKLLTKLLVK